MSDNESWVQQQVTRQLRRGAEAIRLATRMLMFSDTNKVITVSQARYSVLEQMAYERLSYTREAGSKAFDWMLEYRELLEKNQLVIGEPVNSRLAFNQTLALEVVDQQQKEQKALTL